MDYQKEAPLLSTKRSKSHLNVSWLLSVAVAFIAGVVACLGVERLVQHFQNRGHINSITPGSLVADAQTQLENPAHHFPPSHPTNAYTSLFPTDVGYAGPTATGNEAGAAATAPAYPVHTNTPQLVGPAKLGGQKGQFDVFKYWGNLSPWYSVSSAEYGLPETSPEAPETCKITGLHFLHRHGARYPTSSNEGPAQFKQKIQELKDAGKSWKASDALSFLNDWDFPLGAELLTPFGRQQMYDLGVNLRIKYGFLLNGFTDALPVFRTESQNRMLHSALNFAIGFFGYPHQDQYLQSITYETGGVNNTLAPYMTCPNDNNPNISSRAGPYQAEWKGIYLKNATARLQGMLDGMDINVNDVYNFQMLCAYETVALGYSKFCELFTEEEWEGFEYALDLYFWYDSAYGYPLARAMGIGYVQELVARLTHTPISIHNSTTNSTLDDNPITFPLNQPLYVDATHEVVVLNIITALNLTNFAATGPLPSDHIPPNRSFISSQLAPFGTHIDFQHGPQIRIVINDGVTPLTGIKGCPENKHGLCPVDTFVSAQKQIIAETDWAWSCKGDWTLPPGPEWTTTTGDAPKKGST
ncbi:hypothetical protein FRB99_000985 [Tulasnella sp. 403]|nr:hypothetical protein FRB99_000985 [Tulasnella sp. 403]